jgi:hypothetical protein
MAKDYVMDLTKISANGRNYDLERWIVRFVKRQPTLGGEKVQCLLKPAKTEEGSNEILIWEKINLIRIFRFFVFHEVRHLVEQFVKDSEMKDDEEITELYEAAQWKALVFFLAILLEEGEE